ncbi:MAG TPA: CPBP family intramembrane glutamic endopeptidase [Myxococcaceae bacterium]
MTRSTRGVLAYLALTFGLTWLPAWLLGSAWIGEGRPLVTRLLASSLFYAACMGWQPFAVASVVGRWVDPSGGRDRGLAPARTRFIVLAAAAPLVLAAAAVALASLFGLIGAPVPDSLHGHAEPELALAVPSAGKAFALTVAFLATGALILAQSLGEEIGWRGYFMVHLMRRFGPWKGLFWHGLAWGLWYAPVFVIGREDVEGSTLRSAAFVLTCVLLGVLLGWLRLASRSIVPTTIANAVLTLTAGLPFLLQGVDVGLRGSAYGPPGWLPMAAAIAILAAGRWRATVAVPREGYGWIVYGQQPERRVLH